MENSGVRPAFELFTYSIIAFSIDSGEDSTLSFYTLKNADMLRCKTVFYKKADGNCPIGAEV